jgi:hypothetical protein
MPANYEKLEAIYAQHLDGTKILLPDADLGLVGLPFVQDRPSKV